MNMPMCLKQDSLLLIPTSVAVANSLIAATDVGDLGF